jgi:hypothetical protein
MNSLSLIDQMVHRVNFVNTFVDTLASKIMPSIPAAGDCLISNNFKDVFMHYECWESCSQGNNKCVRVFTRFYKYPDRPDCPQLFKICNSRDCIGTAECAGS